MGSSGGSGVEWVAAAVRKVAPRAGRTRVVAIDGRSGAGKTWFAQRLRGELGAAVVPRGDTAGMPPEDTGVASSGATAGVPAGGVAIVSLEDLYGGWDGLERGIGVLVSEVLEPLAAGRTARVPRYDWVARGWAEPVVLEPPDVLIVEGVGAGARRAAAFESLLVWLEAPTAVRKQRALDRDGETFAPHWDEWAAHEDAMLARERTPERADLVFRTG